MELSDPNSHSGIVKNEGLELEQLGGAVDDNSSKNMRPRNGMPLVVDQVAAAHGVWVIPEESDDVFHELRG